MTMAEENGVSAVGFTTRDLVIQANTKLDLIGPELAQIRQEQVAMRTDIETLKVARAVDDAAEGAVKKHTEGRWTRTERTAAAIYSAVVAMILLWGPLLVHYIESR